MRCFRILSIFAILFVACFVRCIPTGAQDDANFEIGLKPYGSYNMGNIDSVNLGNGSLGVDIPLISYPQRGGKLKLDFVLQYFNDSMSANQVCYPPPYNSTCYWIPSESNAGMAIIDKDQPSIVNRTSQGGSGYGPVVQINDPDGAVHLLGATGTNEMESVDATGYHAVGGGTAAVVLSITDSDGVSYTMAPNETANTTCWDTIVFGTCYPDREDTNANQITFSYTTGWTDTMARTIPLPTESTNQSEFTGCTGPNTITSVYLWNFPGVNGGTYPLKFCYYGGGPSGMGLQSIVLPNSTAWTFQYVTVPVQYAVNNPAIDIITLSQIAFPIGGTLSYTWTTTAPCYDGNNFVANFAVSTRTLNPNDGVSPTSTWSYNYGSTSTTLTDPLGDDSVHTFGLGGCNLYETETQFYQGSHTSGTLLKTVTAAYSYVQISGWGQDLVEDVSVVPTSVTTAWANGQTTQTAHAYDSGFQFQDVNWSQTSPYTTSGLGPNFSGPYGKELTRSEYDYGNGAPGPLLRTTTTNYLAFSNSAYLNANLLNIPSSAQVTGSGPGSLSDYGYDAAGGVHGNLTSTSRWLNTTGGYLVSSNVYNSNGLVTSSTDPNGNPTTFGYTGSYAGSGPTTITNPKQQVTTNAYDANTGLLTSTTDPNSLITSYQYDDMLRTTLIKYPNGGQTVFSYPTPNDVDISEAISNSSNRLSYLVVDGIGRKIRQAVTNQETLSYDEADTCYDGLGRVSFKSYPFQDSGPFAKARSCASPELGDSFAYDGLSRTTGVTHSDSSLISTSYSGSYATVTDEQGKTRQSYTDGLGRLTQVIENPSGLNYTSAYTDDALDNLTGVTQAGSRQRTFVYDSLSRLTSSTNPEANWSATNQAYVATTYSYDADGNLINKTEPAQNQQSTSTVTLTYCYDALNRMTAKGYTSQTCAKGLLPTPVATYVYDGGALPSGCSVGSFSYGLAIGQRTAMCDAAGSEAWSYTIVSGTGWQTTDQRTTNALTKTAVYQYNFLGSPTSIQYPSGNVISYGYNLGNRPISASDSTNNYVSGAHYFANGAQCWAVLGGVTTTSETFNTRLQPNELQAINSVVSYPGNCTSGLGQTGNLIDLTYNFDLGSDNGNVMNITNNRDTTRSQSFPLYDALNRIVQATASTYSASPAHCWGESYQYDNQTSGGAWGNLTSIGVASSSYNGCTQESLSVTATAQNRNTTDTFDTAGNLTTILGMGGGTFTYDAENHLTQAAVNSTAGYVYDGDGKRVEKTSSGTAYKLYWYGTDGSILDETDQTGSTTNSNFNEYVFFGGKRIAWRTIN
jgi:YD repeat-containing protein